jgi:two-component system CheB/CheR fusion protein
MFGIGTAQLRQPLRDLDLSYRPVELRSLLERVLSNDRPIVLRSVENAGAQTPDLAFLDVHLLPLGDEELAGVLVAFTPVGHQRLLQDELERTQREVQTAYEELQSVIEELETTNEELQSTNEELETTNEELHSTNEELETMNEELQSTNDELGTVNTELRKRGTDLDEVNRFLHAILRSLRAAVVVMTSDLTVRAWNEQAEELWGLRADEVTGQHFLNLDIGLPVDQLRQPIRDCLAGAGDPVEVQVDAVNRRGRTVRCNVSVSPLLGGSIDEPAAADGVILVMTVD